MKTIIYYTSNLKDQNFERKVIDCILEAKGDLPLISVSQKPMDFGENICVGDVGYSYLNAFRQILIGCEKATTSYVVMAESDCLYPVTGYFNFIPTDTEMVYSYDNVWILWKDMEKYRRWKRKDMYHKKDMTHASLIYGRKELIKILEDALKGLPEWDVNINKFPFYPEKLKFEAFHGDAIVCIKTDAAKNAGTKLDESIPAQKSIWYWGNGKELKERIFKK